MSTLPPPTLRQLLCLDLYAASRAIIKAYGVPLKKLGVTYPQYLVLVALWEENEQPVLGLSEKLSLDSGTLSPLLKRLEASGLVVRERSDEDERRVLVRLTREGSALQAKAGELMKSMACRLDMDPAEVHRLQSTLREIARRFDTQ